MNLEILKQKEIPLFKRKRVSAMVKFTGATPSRIELTKELAKKLKSKEDATVLRHIYTRFGNTTAKVIAHVYDDEKAAAAMESKGLLAKHKPKQEEES